MTATCNQNNGRQIHVSVWQKILGSDFLNRVTYDIHMIKEELKVD